MKVLYTAKIDIMGHGNMRIVSSYSRKDIITRAWSEVSEIISLYNLSINDVIFTISAEEV